MKYASLSDIHLGQRRFSAVEGGRNLREQDIERAWFRAVDKIVELQPDLVTIAGDVFEHPRVSSHAIRAWRDGVRRIVRETPAILVAVQGNHDAARSLEVLSPLVIPEDYDDTRIILEPRRIFIKLPRTDESVSVTCLPFVALGKDITYSLDPDPGADLNVLIIHAAVNTSAENVERLPVFYAGRDSLDVGRLAEQYDVIAAGDYHDYRRLHPTRAAFYSGSLEFVSSNIWAEDPKGMVHGDTSKGDIHFVELPTRAVGSYEYYDLVGERPVDAWGVNDALADIRTWQVDGDIVRLVVPDFPRSERDDVDWRLVRELKHRCMHFQLDIQFAKAESITVDRRDRPTRTLVDEARDFFASDEEPVRTLALSYLGGEHAAAQ